MGAFNFVYIVFAVVRSYLPADVTGALAVCANVTDKARGSVPSTTRAQDIIDCLAVVGSGLFMRDYTITMAVLAKVAS